mgnify:CR=1 FL=1
MFGWLNQGRVFCLSWASLRHHLETWLFQLFEYLGRLFSMLIHWSVKLLMY